MARLVQVPIGMYPDEIEKLDALIGGKRSRSEKVRELIRKFIEKEERKIKGKK